MLILVLETMKKKISFAALFLVSFTRLVLAQPDGQFVKFNELSFKNDPEKTAFEKYNASKDKTASFDLLFCTYDKSRAGDKAAALRRIEECVSYLKKETADKNNVKKVKFTYDYIHKQFLKIYKEKNGFMDLFASGEYNCLSATALYAIIFSKLSIPYQIRETPTHVYLVAYPDSEKILIETTSPAKGYYQFNSTYVNNFVKSLYESKVITKADYESTPASDLFNKYYFTSEGISLFELSGLQYSNFAIYSIESEDIKNANEEVKKALFIFPCDKHRYILKSTLASLITKNKYNDPESVQELVILCRFNNEKDKQMTNAVILGEFSDLMQTQLIQNSNYDLFGKSYAQLMDVLADSTLKSDISFGYHYELGRLGYSNSKSMEYVLGHLSAAYKINPLNANLRSMILDAMAQQLRKLNDSKEVMAQTDSFAVQYDFVKENEMYVNIKANCYLDLAYQDYFYGNVMKGDANVKKFEEIIKTKSTASAVASLVEKAFAQGAIEYYKKGNYAKAKKMLETGLIYAPNNFGLERRLSQFK